MPDVLTGLDQIQFRRTDSEYGYFLGNGSAASVEVLINGIELTHLWAQAEAGGVLALEAQDAGADLAIWGPYPPSPGPVAEVPSGFTPVVTCGCGIFGCGGGYARVTFQRDRVMWKDFHSAAHDRLLDIGTFIFARQQYESARHAASDINN